MTITEMSKEKLLDLAKNSSDGTILKELRHSLDMLVRRAVARNIHTPREVLESLSADPVLNVSYMASNNSNNYVKRVFEDISHPCVTCQHDERHMVCHSCDTMLSYRAV